MALGFGFLEAFDYRGLFFGANFFQAFLELGVLAENSVRLRQEVTEFAVGFECLHHLQQSALQLVEAGVFGYFVVGLKQPKVQLIYRKKRLEHAIHAVKMAEDGRFGYAGVTGDIFESCCARTLFAHDLGSGLEEKRLCPGKGPVFPKNCCFVSHGTIINNFLSFEKLDSAKFAEIRRIYRIFTVLVNC